MTNKIPKHSPEKRSPKSVLNLLSLDTHNKIPQEIEEERKKWFFIFVAFCGLVTIVFDILGIMGVFK